MSDQKRYFLLMQDDHRTASNRLREDFRREVRDKFNQTITSDPKNTLSKLSDLESEFNAKFPRCTALKGEFYAYAGKFRGSNDFYSIHGLFHLTFFEVKEVANG